MQKEKEDCGKNGGVKGNFAKNENIKSKIKRDDMLIIIDT
jgi:hypothetical protein